MSQSQLFIQHCLSSRTFSEAELLDLLKKIYDSESNSSEIIQKTRKTLGAYGLDLVKGLDQVSGEGFWYLINTKQDTLASLSTGYSGNEMTFMKLLIEGIVSSDNNAFCLTYHEALRKTAEMNISTFKNKEAQFALDSFVKDKWLDLNNGKFSLGNRALAELEGYLRDNYSEDLLICYVCNNLVTRGHICHYCGKSIHEFCYSELVSDQTSRSCLNCNKELDTSDSTIGSFRT